jgi:hypothetical protein
MKSPWLAMALCIIVVGSPATAQLALPGAAAPDTAGAAAKAPSPNKPRKPPAPPASYAPPAATAVIGRSVLLNGASGEMQFSGRADALRIDRLTLLGEVISSPAQQCRIDVGGGGPIEVKSLGKPDGLLRFAADVPACPFEFDILDEAVLVPAQLGACVFKAADCQASPSGLWGPAGGALEKEAKLIERARARAEAAAAANYRTLEGRLNDPAKASELAREQSRFIADRQDICRNYARESVHNFCATRLTEARAAFLKARIDEASPAAITPDKPAPKHKHKPRPAPVPPT